MMRKLLLFLAILLNCSFLVIAQSAKKTAIVKGKLVNSASHAPFYDAKITILELNTFTNSDGDGSFSFSEVPFGNITLIISGSNAKRDTIVKMVDKAVTDLGDLSVVYAENSVSENGLIPTIALEESSSSSSDDDGASALNASGPIVASRDPFVNASVFVLGMYHFQPRGAQRNGQELQVNGIPVNAVETGNASWATVGGLNDVFHGRNITYGLGPSQYTFGGSNGSTYLEATAADQREETKVSYSITDRNYRNRLMFTKSSGLMKNGWAYSVSFSKRWADEGYVPGTYFDGYSYYAAVSKVIKKGQLNFTTFGTPTKRAKAAAATQEAYDLAGSNYYNHNWGYDNGKKRNFATENVFQPISMLNYEYKPNEKTRWNTAVSYEFGKDKNGNGYVSAARNPLGDYYTKMPSYYLTLFNPDPVTAARVKASILANPSSMELDWQEMYDGNRSQAPVTVYNVNGVSGQTYTGKEAYNFLSDKVNSIKKFTFNTNIEQAINAHKTFYGGFTFTSQRTESYNQLSDLLGADFATNYNQFASQQYVGNPNYYQNDLNTPNRIIKVGDKWDYDYAIRYNNAKLWGQYVYEFDRFNYFVSLQLEDNSFRREGFMKNGLFANNSDGLSPAQGFYNYAVKTGGTYKIDARSALFLNLAYNTTPPTADNTYISAGTRDFLVNNPLNQKNFSAEGGYFLKSSKWNVRAVGYLSQSKDGTLIKRFFNDDPAYYTFVNYVMQNVNTRSVGTEFGADYKLTRNLNVVGVLSIGQAIYTDKANISVYKDNDTLQKAVSESSYLKNYNLAVGPQTAASLGFNYRPKRDLYININFNYFDRNYVDINPNRRTQAAADLVQPGSVTWHKIYDQEELPSVFTVDLRAGKSFQLSRMSDRINKLSHNTVLQINGGISNLLDNKKIINSGFEQLRYDFANINPDKFANKYMYGMGINFVLNVVLKF